MSLKAERREQRKKNRRGHVSRGHKVFLWLYLIGQRAKKITDSQRRTT